MWKEYLQNEEEVKIAVNIKDPEDFAENAIEEHDEAIDRFAALMFSGHRVQSVDELVKLNKLSLFRNIIKIPHLSLWQSRPENERGRLIYT